jgi:hypothetical protein
VGTSHNTVTAYHNRPDGYLASVQGCLGFFQGFAHVAFVDILFHQVIILYKN